MTQFGFTIYIIIISVSVCEKIQPHVLAYTIQYKDFLPVWEISP